MEPPQKTWCEIVCETVVGTSSGGDLTNLIPIYLVAFACAFLADGYNYCYKRNFDEETTKGNI